MSNLLIEVAPSLLAEWHSSKNSTLDVSKVVAGSKKKVWWIGKECKHEWEARINSRASGTNCPYCSGRRAIPYVNDISTLYPELISSWHSTNVLLMHEQLPGSQETAKWICSLGHVWETKIRNRVRGSKCLVCAGKQVLVGYNDIATTHPDIIKLWDYERNTVLPTEISHGSMQEIHFRCENSHTWTYTLNKQVRVASGCSFCAGRKVAIGENDLSTTHPQFAQQWHPTKNDNLLPTMVTASMDKSVWWLGKCDHEWEMALYSRTHKTRGQNCPVCVGRQVLKGFNDLATVMPHLITEWDYFLNSSTPDMFTRGSNEKVSWKCSQKHTWQAKIADRAVKNSQCPSCSAAILISKPEQAIADFLSLQGLSVTQSDRKILNGLELDIYIPSHKIAIEYNGLYWHTANQGKDSTYHQAKYLACKALGIQLVQIWEDEWQKNPEQIKAMLLHKLGITQQEKIFARKTVITQLKKPEIEAFLEQHHVQGYAAGSHYLGLREKRTGEIVSVLVLKKEANNTLNIIRYATSKNVVGGFTKLLKYAELTYKPACFITFSDHCVSDGGLYANNGFIADKELAPDYRYVVQGKRQHKFGYRLKRFRNDPNLKYEEGLTERELAALNGIPRIWDAGKTRWVKMVNLM